jgi:hypothetical protein
MEVGGDVKIQGRIFPRREGPLLLPVPAYLYPMQSSLEIAP